MRPKTLPLALSGTLLGNLIASNNQLEFNYLTFSLCLTTAILLQILSNFANDLGDFQKGTDVQRTDRLLNTGAININQMKFAVYITAIFALITGIILLIVSIQHINLYFWMMLLLGLLGILAAYFYTAGKKSYGYSGFGDISVFIFFGLVSVNGSYFLQTQILDFNVFILSFSVGLLSVGVLNINNIRDIESDKANQKNTIPVKIGKKNALIYQLGILVLSILSIVIYNYRKHQTFDLLLIHLLIILLTIHFWKLKKAYIRSEYDGQLKFLSLSTLFIMVYISVFHILKIY